MSSTSDASPHSDSVPATAPGLGGPLAGSRVVVTGGSTGIGLATARALVFAGARVVLASRSRAKLHAAAHALTTETRPASDDTVSTSVLDVTDADAVRSFFAEVGPFDHLVTSAGEQAIDAPFLQLPEDVARQVFEVKYWGQYRAVHAAVSSGALRQGGSVTLVSAWLARKPTAGFPSYAAVDGAVESLARVLSLELAPTRVNVLSPGVIATPLYDNLDPQDLQATVAQVSAALPLGRVGTPEECAQAVLYLMSNTYSTGAVIDVDGGWA